MQKPFLTALLSILILSAGAQAPQVPHKIHFAGLTLSIRDDARREIQKDVDALTQSPRHFNIKAERARTYFPIIEKIFKEEGVPDDFKFLVLQESALIPDAVSVSNAVGFWQFKDFTAAEMGLRVDKEVDERMNIVASTRAAARYIKKNNFYFDNWLYALQAYQMGAGGVMRSVKDSHSGEKHLEINSKTYWYVKKYLAHKVAFEDAVKAPGQTQVITFENKSRRTLDDLAVEIAVEPVHLKELNKWALKGRIPDDKAYTVIVPAAPASAAIVASKTPSFPSETRASTPRITGAPSAASAKDGRIKINGLAAIKARPSEDAKALAARGGIDLSTFLKANEMSISEPIRDGEVYFLQKKRNRATEAYYTTQAGETMWAISQKFGVKVGRLERYNRMRAGENPKPGQVVWLASRKPRNESGSPLPAEVIEVDDDKTFNWSAAPVVDSSGEKEKPIVVETIKTQGESGEDRDTTEVHVPVKSDTTATLVQVDKPAQQQPPKLDTVSTTLAVVTDTVARIPLKVIPTEHQVKPGETLYGIARLYELEVMDLAKWNELNLQQAIKPGQKLTLVSPDVDKKEGTPAKPKEIIHEVKASDTLYSVARKYNVTIKELMDWNGKKDFNVSVGEKLRVIQ